MPPTSNMIALNHDESARQIYINQFCQVATWSWSCLCRPVHVSLNDSSFANCSGSWNFAKQCCEHFLQLLPTNVLSSASLDSRSLTFIPVVLRLRFFLTGRTDSSLSLELTRSTASNASPSELCPSSPLTVSTGGIICHCTTWPKSKGRSFWILFQKMWTLKTCGSHSPK